jgi:hypothetical protein
MLVAVLDVWRSGSLECALLVVPTTLDTWLAVLVAALVYRICWFAVALALALPSLMVRICNIFDAPCLIVVQRDDYLHLSDVVGVQRLGEGATNRSA